MIEIYTDGSSKGNGTRTAEGGFAVIVVDNDKIIDSFVKFETGVTNNQMEMKAILWAMNKYGSENPPIVYSDSSYCVNTFTQWYLGWKENGWIKKDKRVPENLQLIKLYDIMYNVGKKINLKKIAGHNGHKYNELCDKLCTGKITIGELYE